jgi:CO/xanthine dehydrogenase Mo-binding subunit
MYARDDPASSELLVAAFARSGLDPTDAGRRIPLQDDPGADDRARRHLEAVASLEREPQRMTTMVVGPALLAANETRVEGREKVSGQALYAADMQRPGMLWAAFVTSPHPHAKIVQVDVDTARAMPGVRAVITGGDVGDVRFGAVLADWPVLAYERVRLIGEYVAAVAADTREQAEAAAAAVDVVYDVLPAILDTEQAIVDAAPLVHEDDAAYAFTGGTRAPRPYPNL